MRKDEDSLGVEEAMNGNGLRRVGAVAQLTGLSTHTLRAWERRHSAIDPRRTDSGLRLYSDEDVTRLRLLKALTDRGESISVIAGLDPDRLRERLQTYQLADQPIEGESKQPRRLGLVSPDLARQIASHSTEILPLEVVLEAESLEGLLDKALEFEVELVVLDIRKLGANPSESLAQCRDRLGDIPIWVAYTFAPRAHLNHAVDAGAHLLRLPLRLAALRDQLGAFATSHPTEDLKEGTSILHSQIPHDLSTDPPERFFTNEQLARLQEMSGSVACECPSHLSSLVSGLLAFEEYARTCESTNPQDAAIHQALERGTGIARSVMEELLQRLCEHDKLVL